MKTFILKNMYKWHRWLGIGVLIPVVLWTISGMMHPFMSHWFKTEIPHSFYEEEKVQFLTSDIPLKAVLKINKLKYFKNARYVRYLNLPYYQVKTIDNELRYFSTSTGKELIEGDEKYAEQMARFMLEDQKSKVKSSKKLTTFTDQYKFVNRLLPVWKVSFDREDGMDAYVETASSKFSTFNDKKRKVFIWVFSNFHNWTFLSFLPMGAQLGFMLFFVGLILFSAISGIVIYGFHWKYFKKPFKDDKVGKLKRYHRSLGIVFSLMTLLFAFSGAYHLTRKWIPDDRFEFLQEPTFSTNELPENNLKANAQQLNISFVKIDGNNYINCAQSPGLEARFIPFSEKGFGADLEAGTESYGRYLLKKYAQRKGEIATYAPMDWLTEFTNEYGFVNKRLPVMAFHLPNSEHSSYYIEPSTGHLAAYIQDGDRREGFSFAFLHKFHFLDSIGKNGRDGILVFFAFSIFLISILGLLIVLKKR